MIEIGSAPTTISACDWSCCAWLGSSAPSSTTASTSPAISAETRVLASGMTRTVIVCNGAGTAPVGRIPLEHQ